MKRLRLALAVLVGSLALSGCDFDVYSLPLPGGTDTGDDAMTLKVEFEDVLDLVPHSSVKVNDVSVGKVTDIELDDYQATLTLEIRGDTELPENTVAEIRQTSLLGEKFVSLEPPAEGATGTLADGATIPIERTGRNPEVEEVLGALSLILNGGGVAQLKTITQELNKTLSGREDNVRSVLRQIESFAGTLDENKGDIVEAIEALDRLSVSANRQMDTIDAALDELPSALRSIDAQRGDLVKMLRALSKLGDVGTRVIKASKESTIESVRLLQPVLSQLAASGDDFVKAFNVFLTYPFVDEVVGRDPQVARNLHMGDYTNLSITLEVDLSAEIPPLDIRDVVGLPQQVIKEVQECLATGPNLLHKQCTELVGTTVLVNYCTKKEYAKTTLCVLLKPLLIGLPNLGDMVPNQGGGHAGGNGGRPGGGTGNGGGLGGLLGGVLGNVNEGLGGLLGRAPALLPREAGGATVEQLVALYDPALVSMLAPPMIVPSADQQKGGGQQ
ncbi:MCE family protein [Nocardioides sp. SYSU D00038]|uniref:MCE family protein n=1 Tax=Nocardioides sp. SYSU D00038 TaxID=2812554 RepID=UPI00196763EB|nr:MCE family protein [Nocardioides sp. SYSU D00038]